ncbi:MAG: DUF4834 family protein [Flavobacteriaceae bacterium]|nr:DUF4834 family protein [Bacteroidia bacterium]MBT8286722.1 DUF4834 family protein [Bacteroidia bacterium]NNF75370.1 DUF4834 family protein [Flavobacteriaceae bacterium]NNK73518.1 DUF4834 family protein [Flavobacteriaceae bacterium]
MVQMASIPGFLRTILIILLIYYGAKIISRLLAPYFLKYLSKKAEKRFGQQFENHQTHNQSQHKEGETVIDKMPAEEKGPNKEIGEYVDYEEID